MRRSAALAIAAGGIVGATCRWAAIELWPTGRGFPWAVFVVNVVGSFIVGVALAEEWDHPTWSLWARDAIGIGFCGGLTTFSTFAVETAGFLRDGRTSLAFTYVSASLAAAVCAAIAGAAARRRVGALSLPLEGPDDVR
jgi:CrcB protein